MFDLVVIGGGPAGTSAAITAAREGARVLLLERGRFPRHKVCGEFVSAESLGLLRTLLGAQSDSLAGALSISSARVFLGGHLLGTPLDPPAASIARFDLDEALWNSAIRAGVETRQQTSANRIQGVGPFRIFSSAGEFDTRSVINASGRWSNLNSANANDSSEGKWLGLKGHFAEQSPPDSVDLYFFDGGYCGVSAVRLSNDTAGRVNACAMVRAGTATTLREVFSRNHLLLERSQSWRPLTETFSTWPLVFREPEAVEANIPRAGDAAAFVDPFIGDGISMALRGGALAATSLLPFLRGELTLEAAAGNYARAYRQQLAPVFHASSRIRRALRLPRWVQEPALALLEHVPGFTRRLVSATR